MIGREDRLESLLGGRQRGAATNTRVVDDEANRLPSLLEMGLNRSSCSGHRDGGAGKLRMMIVCPASAFASAATV